MYAVLVLVLLVQQPPKKEEPETEAALREKVTKQHGLEPNAKDSPQRKLQKERCIAQALALAQYKQGINFGNWTDDYLAAFLDLNMTFPENLAELTDKPTDKVKCYELRVENFKFVEEFYKFRVEFGTSHSYLEKIVRAACLEADIRLLKLKESLKGEK
jgi:hypothetical protein